MHQQRVRSTCVVSAAAYRKTTAIHTITLVLRMREREGGMMQDDGGNEVSGFKQSISKTATARLLKLKPEDQALLKGEPLKQGRFTWVTEEGTQERFIVASCGKVTLRWNFRYGLTGTAALGLYNMTG